MYDVSFFMDSLDMKQRILARQFSAGDRDSVHATLRSLVGTTPRVFNVETTSHCNMRCVMCQRTTDLTRKPEHLDQELFLCLAEQIEPLPGPLFMQWQAFVDQNLRPGTEPSENNFYFDILARAVTLHGFGEPLLDPLLAERVAALTERGVPSYFSCNPVNAGPELVTSLMDAGLGWIKFALDSLDDARAKEIRGPRCDATQSLKNIEQALEIKARTGADTIIVLTMLDFFGPEHPESETRAFLDRFAGKDAYTYVKSVDNKWLLNTKGADGLTRGDDASHYSAQYCEYPWTSLTVLADGSVVPCTQDINATWVFGNVREQSLEEIWNSSTRAEFLYMQATGDAPDDFMCKAKCDQHIIADFLEA